ncbi:MAG: class I SAM-dependent methyltransferase [Christiangramia sp.]|uniref:class I SAM-dependent methyltransferase n=1 Tax=Christiangramia sp. TaxID=1931228 RepID=UPI003242A7B8
MKFQDSLDLFGNVDIYVIDQILKGRYQQTDTILDAGCGEGRNLKWFYRNNFTIYGMDLDPERLKMAKVQYPDFSDNFTEGRLDELPYENEFFQHVLCCAVLHFAEDQQHFRNMFAELVRVLKPGGSLLIRVASNIGLDGKSPEVQDPKNKKSAGYFITRNNISEILTSFELELIEPVKTTNVQDVRAMTTLVFRKK